MIFAAPTLADVAIMRGWNFFVAPGSGLHVPFGVWWGAGLLLLLLQGQCCCLGVLLQLAATLPHAALHFSGDCLRSDRCSNPDEAANTRLHDAAKMPHVNIVNCETDAKAALWRTTITAATARGIGAWRILVSIL